MHLNGFTTETKLPLNHAVPAGIRTPSNINIIYKFTSLKSTFSGLQYCNNNMGPGLSSFFHPLLPRNSAK